MKHSGKWKEIREQKRDALQAGSERYATLEKELLKVERWLHPSG